MAAKDRFEVVFWGVRGSIACPGPDTLKYGGNTPCVEVRCGDYRLIFDAGTGLRPLGAELVAAGVHDADLFLSHTHYDHVMGFPFFCFAFNPKNTLRIWSGHLHPECTTEQAMQGFMRPPFFPVSTDIFEAQVSFHDFKMGDMLEPSPGVKVSTAALNHPNGAAGYRVDYAGKSMCYLTDTEHVDGKPDQNVLALIKDADIVVYDSMFTDEEFRRYAGWGHSTWQEGVRLCQAAGAKTLAIFHHLPERDDAALDAIAAEAKRAFKGAVIAREGLTLSP